MRYSYQKPVAIKYHVKAVDPKSVAWAKEHPLRVLDNGGRPFLVDLQETHIDVYKRMPDKKEESEGNFESAGFYVDNPDDIARICYSNMVRIGRYAMKPTDTVWLGDGDYNNYSFKSMFTGCVVVIDRAAGSSHNIIAISSTIDSVKLKEPIKNLFASVGNSGVPYGFAITASGLILTFKSFNCTSGLWRVNTFSGTYDDLFQNLDCLDNRSHNRFSEYFTKVDELHYKTLHIRL